LEWFLSWSARIGRKSPSFPLTSFLFPPTADARWHRVLFILFTSLFFHCLVAGNKCQGIGVVASPSVPLLFLRAPFESVAMGGPFSICHRDRFPFFQVFPFFRCGLIHDSAVVPTLVCCAFVAQTSLTCEVALRPEKKIAAICGTFPFCLIGDGFLRSFRLGSPGGGLTPFTLFLNGIIDFQAGVFYCPLSSPCHHYGAPPGQTFLLLSGSLANGGVGQQTATFFFWLRWAGALGEVGWCLDFVSILWHSWVQVPLAGPKSCGILPFPASPLVFVQLMEGREAARKVCCAQPPFRTSQAVLGDPPSRMSTKGELPLLFGAYASPPSFHSP